MIDLITCKNILLFMERRVQETVFTKMSSKGQVVIPARIRKKLEMREGSVLAVTAQKDMIVLKRV